MSPEQIKEIQDRERELYMLGIRRGDRYFRNRWTELVYIMNLLGIERRDK